MNPLFPLLAMGIAIMLAARGLALWFRMDHLGALHAAYWALTAMFLSAGSALIVGMAV